MNARHLFLSVVVALAMLAGYNLAILKSSRSSQRQRARAAVENVPSDTQALFIGNSLMEAGCSLAAFTDAWAQKGVPPKAVSLALGATTPVEHALILQRALHGLAHPKFIVYGFFDDQLNAPVNGEWSLLVGNRALSYYYPESAAALYEPNSLLKCWELQFTQHVPMLAERSSLWTQVELLRRHLDEIGMPKHATNRYGRVEDFNALQAGDVASFNRRVGGIVDAHAGFSPPVQELLRLAREAGAKLILVEMPMPSRHRQVFYASPVWPKMRRHLQDLAAREGATYLVASDWVADDNKFEDAAHLNENGAKDFSAQLATAIFRLQESSVMVSAAP